MTSQVDRKALACSELSIATPLDSAFPAFLLKGLVLYEEIPYAYRLHIARRDSLLS